MHCMQLCDFCEDDWEIECMYRFEWYDFHHCTRYHILGRHNTALCLHLVALHVFLMNKATLEFYP